MARGRHTKVVCSRCRKRGEWRVFRIVQKEHQNSHPDRAYPFVCKRNKCGEVFKTRSIRDYHMKTHNRVGSLDKKALTFQKQKERNLIKSKQLIKFYGGTSSTRAFDRERLFMFYESATETEIYRLPNDPKDVFGFDAHDIKSFMQGMGRKQYLKAGKVLGNQYFCSQPDKIISRLVKKLYFSTFPAEILTQRSMEQQLSFLGKTEEQILEEFKTSVYRPGHESCTSIAKQIIPRIKHSPKVGQVLKNILVLKAPELIKLLEGKYDPTYGGNKSTVRKHKREGKLFICDSPSRAIKDNLEETLRCNLSLAVDILGKSRKIVNVLTRKKRKGDDGLFEVYYVAKDVFAHQWSLEDILIRRLRILKKNSLLPPFGNKLYLRCWIDGTTIGTLPLVLCRIGLLFQEGMFCVSESNRIQDLALITEMSNWAAYPLSESVKSLKEIGTFIRKEMKAHRYVYLDGIQYEISLKTFCVDCSAAWDIMGHTHGGVSRCYHCFALAGEYYKASSLFRKSRDWKEKLASFQHGDKDIPIWCEEGSLVYPPACSEVETNPEILHIILGHSKELFSRIIPLAKDKSRFAAHTKLLVGVDNGLMTGLVTGRNFRELWLLSDHLFLESEFSSYLLLREVGLSFSNFISICYSNKARTPLRIFRLHAVVYQHGAALRKLFDQATMSSLALLHYHQLLAHVPVISRRYPVFTSHAESDEASFVQPRKILGQFYNNKQDAIRCFLIRQYYMKLKNNHTGCRPASSSRLVKELLLKDPFREDLFIPDQMDMFFVNFISSIADFILLGWLRRVNNGWSLLTSNNSSLESPTIHCFSTHTLQNVEDYLEENVQALRESGSYIGQLLSNVVTVPKEVTLYDYDIEDLSCSQMKQLIREEKKSGNSELLKLSKKGVPKTKRDLQQSLELFFATEEMVLDETTLLEAVPSLKKQTLSKVRNAYGILHSIVPPPKRNFKKLCIPNNPLPPSDPGAKKRVTSPNVPILIDIGKILQFPIPLLDINPNIPLKTSFTQYYPSLNEIIGQLSSPVQLDNQIVNWSIRLLLPLSKTVISLIDSTAFIGRLGDEFSLQQPNLINGWVLFPVHLQQEGHWYILVIDNMSKQLFSFDSLGINRKDNVAFVLSTLYCRFPVLSVWSTFKHVNVSKKLQNDATSCGLFVILFCSFIIHSFSPYRALSFIEYQMKKERSFLHRVRQKIQQVLRHNLYPSPGLFNIGNSCYINSALQMLFSLPIIRGSQDPTVAEAEKLWFQSKSSLLPLSTTKFISNLGSQMYNGHQDDVLPVLEWMMDKMLKEQCSFYVKSCQQCLCGETNNVTPYYIVRLPFLGTVQTSVNAFFQLEELDCDNRCSKCLTTIFKQLSVFSYPLYLFVQVKRFNFTSKDCSRLEVELYLMLGEVRYEFHSACLHLGPSASQGHYKTVKIHGNMFLIYNDATVSAVSSPGVLKDAYVLCYKKSCK